MQHEEGRRRSRWLMRVLEWDDARARYPNRFRNGMPSRVLAFDRVASRLRLGDLIGVYYPASQRHGERSERYLGISRVSGLRRDLDPGAAWIELETAWRFDPPLDLGAPPRRVFLCCDPGWPEADVALFRAIVDAAVRGGWEPAADEAEETPAPPATPIPTPEVELPARAPAPAASTLRPAEARFFGGVDFSGDMRDPRDRTWLAILALEPAGLRVVRLAPAGRHGIERALRDPDAMLSRVDAIGLDFPFGLPVAFAERLLGGSVPERGFWALAHALETMTRPGYLVAIQEFRDTHGEPKRVTDERARAYSPLHRVNPDLGPMTYHGIRMIAEDRSRWVIKPFETAQGRMLLEVYPGALVRSLPLDARPGDAPDRRRAILDALAGLAELPVVVPEPYASSCHASRDAIDAVIAARQAAVAVLSGEAARPLAELEPEAVDRVRIEGWIYGLE